MERTERQNKEIPACAILSAAADIGEGILKNGGEIHRVEDSIERICTAFGAVQVEVFTIPSLIIASMRRESGEYAQEMRRIEKTENNMTRLEEINRISRRLCEKKITLAEFHKEMKAAKNIKVYPLPITCIGAMCAAGGFSLFFGGTILDAFCAMIVGVLLTLSERIVPKFANKMLVMALQSFFSGLCCILLCRIGLGRNFDNIMTGTIMLLIPGIAISTSIRDLFGGDIISGALQLLQCILLALMIAFGYSLAILTMGGIV